MLIPTMALSWEWGRGCRAQALALAPNTNSQCGGAGVGWDPGSGTVWHNVFSAPCDPAGKYSPRRPLFPQSRVTPRHPDSLFPPAPCPRPHPQPALQQTAEPSSLASSQAGSPTLPRKSRNRILVLANTQTQRACHFSLCAVTAVACSWHLVHPLRRPEVTNSTEKCGRECQMPS